jgi:hypothetical protein
LFGICRSVPDKQIFIVVLINTHREIVNETLRQLREANWLD